MERTVTVLLATLGVIDFVALGQIATGTHTEVAIVAIVVANTVLVVLPPIVRAWRHGRHAHVWGPWRWRNVSSLGPGDDPPQFERRCTVEGCSAVVYEHRPPPGWELIDGRWIDARWSEMQL
jgi:hypothetical protein